MATKKNDTSTSDETKPQEQEQPKEASSKDSAQSQQKKQGKAARDAYLEARKEAAVARQRAAGLAPQPKAEGETIEVRAVPGPSGQPRKAEAGGGLLFGPASRTVALETITYRQYHSIMSNPLLEVKGQATKSFDRWAKG